jgi:hypothetical protein
MDLTTNGVVITVAIKFVQTNKEKLTISTNEDKNGESKEPSTTTRRKARRGNGTKCNYKYNFLI